MPACVALLRGVNVGGRSTLPMEQVRRVVSDLGHDDVRTHLASGNVLFSTTESDPGAVAESIRIALADAVGRDIPVLLRAADDLRAVLAGDPYPDADPSRLHIAFLASEPSPEAADAFSALLDDQPEEAVLAGREVYIHYVNGAGRSKIDLARVEKALGVGATARNRRTVAAILDKLTA